MNLDLAYLASLGSSAIPAIEWGERGGVKGYRLRRKLKDLSLLLRYRYEHERGWRSRSITDRVMMFRYQDRGG